MQNHVSSKDGTRIAFRQDGSDASDAPTVVFANSLGSNMSIWDAVLAELPQNLRFLRFDLRGHGQSDVPPAPYAMGQLVADAESVCDACAVKDVVIVGLSVGGMIAQGLAVKRLDLVRGLVLSNTAAKIGHPSLWQDRINSLRRDGMSVMAEQILDRWFGRDFRHSAAAKEAKAMLTSTPLEGYIGVCHAISGTDFFTPTSGLRLPTLGIGGSEDKSTPPDLMRETVELIPGSTLHILPRTGHLPCVEQPKIYAEHLMHFLVSVGHIPEI